jgi:hypothetical protein
MGKEAGVTAVHVVPLCDAVAHHVPGGMDGYDLTHADGWLTIEADRTVPDLGCACGPDTEIVLGFDVPDGYLVTHHSLDGREHHE